jgi:hypothetical protein
MQQSPRVAAAAVTVAAALSLMAAPAHAGRPLQSEDAGVLDAGAWELEAASSRLRSASTEHSVQLARGIGWHSQLALAWGRTQQAGDSTPSITLNGKTQLWQRAGDGAQPALTLAWALGSAREPSRGWRHAATELNLALTHPVGDRTLLHANLGHARDETGGRRATTWSAAWEHTGYAVGGLMLAPMAELFGDDNGAPWWNVGLRLTLTPDVAFIDASHGRQSGDERARLTTVGLKFAF